jgi:hypothetical protein
MHHVIECFFANPDAELSRTTEVVSDAPPSRVSVNFGPKQAWQKRLLGESGVPTVKYGCLVAMSAKDSAIVVGSYRLNEVPPSRDHARQVIWVNGIADKPPFQLFDGIAEIILGLTVDDFELPFRCHDGYQASDTLDYQTKTLFTHAERVLRALSLFKICIRSVPLDDISRSVQQSTAAEKKPAKFSVPAAKAAFHLERPSQIQSFVECFHHAREIVRMYRDLPAPIQRLFRREPGIFEPALIEEFSRAIRSS